MTPSSKRRTLIFTAIGLAILLAGFAAVQFALKELNNTFRTALGENGSVDSLRTGLNGIELQGVRLKAPKNNVNGTAWPSQDQLRAERIIITPAFFDLLIGRLSINSLRIEGAYLSMLRGNDGRLHLLPDYFSTPGAAHPATARNTTESAEISGSSSVDRRTLTINRIELINVSIDVHDASVKPSGHTLQFQKISAAIGKIKLPDLEGQTPITLTGTLKGRHQDGTLALDGYIEPSSKELGLTFRLRGIDLLTLQPYIIKPSAGSFKKGTLDLDLKASIQKGILHAPGTLTLSDLELASGSFMGLPRTISLALLKKKNARVSLKFVLDGNIKDPKFSLNETLSTGIGLATAKALGINFEGLLKTPSGGRRKE